MTTLPVPYDGAVALYVNDPDTFLMRCDVRAVAEVIYKHYVSQRFRRAKPFRLSSLCRAVDVEYVQLGSTDPRSVDYDDFSEAFGDCTVATRHEITAICLEHLLRTGWVSVYDDRVPVLEVDRHGRPRLRGIFYVHEDFITVMCGRDLG